MVLDTVEREAEKKHLNKQIQTQSLTKPWVEVCQEQDECGEEQVQRIQRRRSQSSEENLLEAASEHLGINLE